jgi:hypothetical protein
MKKNVASQSVGVQMIATADGSDFTSTVTVVVTVDSGTQTAGGGSVTHEGNGYHSYALTQAESNGDHIAFTFSGTGAITSTVQVYTAFPQTVDNNTILSGLNDVAATDIVSAGAITTLAGAVVNVDLVDTLTTYTSNTPQTADHTSGIADIPTVAEFNARTLVAASYFDPAADTVATVTTVTTGATSAAQTTAQNDLDIITGATGVNLLAATQASIDAIETDTQTTIPAQITALNNVSATDIVTAGAITTAAGAVANVTTVATTTTNTDMRGTNGANTTVPDNTGISDNGAAIAALNDVSTAQVNAEVLDVLTVDTFAEPGSVPAATSSIKDKISWLFTMNRNKVTQTATTQSIKNDSGAGNIATAAVSDDATTYSRNEFI